jgi:uncharacterized membrane protein YccC
MPAADPAAPPGFGWHERARLLLADLVVFDPRRLGWRLAIRTVIALLVPLELARLLAMPALIWVGIGGYLLAIGDSTDDGDRRQPLRLVVGAMLGGLAVASGVLAGTALPVAVLGMLFWGAVAGLIGVYGNAFATMGLPIAWAYVELGLPAHDHSLAQAARLGALFALGGGLTMACTWLVRIAGPYAPLRRQTADCFRAVATYLDAAAAGRKDSPRDLVSSETNVRATIDEARRVGAELRRGQHGWSGAAQRNLVLIEIAERLFALAALLREAPAEPNPPLAQFAAAAREMAEALSAPTKRNFLRERLAALERMGAAQASPPSGDTGIARETDRRMAATLARAIRIVLGEAPVEGVRVPSLAAAGGPASLLAPLAACLDPNSVVARHALRFGVVAAIAVVIFWFFPPPFGYWIPLTVTVALKPYAGATLARTVQRLVGTSAGILVGSAIMPLLHGPQAEFAALGIAFFWMMAVLPFNYSLAIFFLSAGLIPFEHFLTPGLDRNVALLRLAGTLVGAVLAIVGGHLLWPNFERKTLPALLRASLRSMAAYADRVLGRADQDSFEAAHRKAGLDTTNLQAAIQRTASEIDGDAGSLAAIVLAATALQRMFVSLNAVVNAPPAPAAPAAMARFRAALVPSLEALASGGDPSPALDAGAASPGFLGYEFGRMAGQVRLLRAALARLAAPA